MIRDVRAGRQTSICIKRDWYSHSGLMIKR
jgi:hypothetical protein